MNYKKALKDEVSRINKSYRWQIGAMVENCFDGILTLLDGQETSSDVPLLLVVPGIFSSLYDQMNLLKIPGWNLDGCTAIDVSEIESDPRPKGLYVLVDVCWEEIKNIYAVKTSQKYYPLTAEEGISLALNQNFLGSSNIVLLGSKSQITRQEKRHLALFEIENRSEDAAQAILGYRSNDGETYCKTINAYSKKIISIFPSSSFEFSNQKGKAKWFQLHKRWFW